MTELYLETFDKIAVVTLDAPPVNALTLARYAAIGHMFDSINDMKDINVVIFTAKGSKAFCAGLELREFLAATPEEDPERAEVVRATFKSIRHCKVPVIAAVNGPALGAGSVLASTSDIRIASEKATFSMPEINVGRCGGGAHTGRLVSQGMLRLMAFTGEQMSAWEAHRVGFVERVVPPRLLMPTAMDLAQVIAAKSRIGLVTMKEALNRIEDVPVDEGYEVEQYYSTKLMLTEDAREATRAVVEKRAPVFKGR
ncbi:enoyl-CoA hydratase [Pollutimonas nitritireducens]|uniref:Enoyl-CoA hydratase n=1 Tax=Pollutimonas nitritireducens TaxID=2045209 RepID=A0A2N4UAT6_9BURK|nr:enoyl-CoA hydratase-related protein [Pollutimonas nitritireducens]PLC52141.1 enoyl-CoA hydratase [Pollutimonas nitritireducens]